MHRPAHDYAVEKEIVDRLKGIMALSKEDQQHAQSARGGSDLRKILARHVLDVKFEARLDSNLDIFAV